MKFGTMTLFDPLKPSEGQKFELRNKMADGRCLDMSAVIILKATQQGSAPVRCGCRLWCSIWGCVLAPRGEYDWTARVWGRCSLMSN